MSPEATPGDTLAAREDFAVIYYRPDGWWVAGDGFESEPKAFKAATGHEWRGSKWSVIATKHLPEKLCAEALEDYLDEPRAAEAGT